MNNKICSIYIDNSGPINSSVIKYLRSTYETIFLVGQQVTSRYHEDIPYVYYNYIRYKPNIDIVFQNLLDIETIDIDNRYIRYIYDHSKHNKLYNSILNNINKINSILLLNKNINKELLSDVFNYEKEVEYV